ncbi:MAG: tagaturonate reductase [Oscillospiraceae bacterium]
MENEIRHLNYQTLRQTGYKGYLLPQAPERILQFGEGNFLRAFADYFVDVANERCGFNTKVLMVQPRGAGKCERVNRQQGLFTLYLRGLEEGRAVSDKRVISSISRCISPQAHYEEFLKAAHNPALRFIISNTTEAGIMYEEEARFADAPPKSFPAKLTRFLYERYMAFGDEPGKGLVILPCELIDDNGRVLMECVGRYAARWQLEPGFAGWLAQENLFCSNLVDRIVTGYPAGEAAALAAENGYQDELMNAAERFGLWVIEGPESLKEELPFAKAGLPVLVTQDHKPYKRRKVRILNGAHTTMAMAGYLAGQNLVRECMQNPELYGFVRGAILEEIVPALDMPEAELKAFAADVLERFENPYISHLLLSISLNSISKWRARVLPSAKEYLRKTGRLPNRLVFGFAALLQFYCGSSLGPEGLVAHRGGQAYTVQDEAEVLNFFLQHAANTPEQLALAACRREGFWGENLAALPGFAAMAAASLAAIRTLGVLEALRQLEAGLL